MADPVRVLKSRSWYKVATWGAWHWGRGFGTIRADGFNQALGGHVVAPLGGWKFGVAPGLLLSAWREKWELQALDLPYD